MRRLPFVRGSRAVKACEWFLWLCRCADTTRVSMTVVVRMALRSCLQGGPLAMSLLRCGLLVFLCFGTFHVKKVFS